MNQFDFDWINICEQVSWRWWKTHDLGHVPLLLLVVAGLLCVVSAAALG